MDDNEKHWFKRRRYGYGWVPVSLKGWAVILVYIVALVGLSYFLLDDVPEDEFTAEVGWYLAIVALMTLGMIAFSKQHGPSPKWRWGSKPDDNPEEDF